MMKIARGRWVGAVVLGLALVLVCSIALWRVSRARCFSLTGTAICHVRTTRPWVALTFDDGPTELGVRSLAPVLRREGAHATFFVIGRDLAKRPDLGRELLAQGHELANHSFSHQRMIVRPGGVYDAEIARTQAELSRVGAQSTAFRPPYGKKLFGLPLAVRRAGLSMVMWDIEDPVTTDPAEYARRVVDQARPGSIILMHAMNPENATAREALPAILEGLRRKGLRAVSWRELSAAGR